MKKQQPDNDMFNNHVRQAFRQGPGQEAGPAGLFPRGPKNASGSCLHFPIGKILLFIAGLLANWPVRGTRTSNLAALNPCPYLGVYRALL